MATGIKLQKYLRPTFHKQISLPIKNKESSLFKYPEQYTSRD